jgi:hypothetical protein
MVVLQAEVWWQKRYALSWVYKSRQQQVLTHLFNTTVEMDLEIEYGGEEGADS